MDTMFWVWIGAVVLFCAAEAITPQLVSIWFVGGSIVALIAELCGAELWLQIVLFIAVSGLLLVFTRPLAVKYTKANKVSTNADRVIGQTAIVTETIDNVNGTGLATVMGQSWTARSQDGAIIQKGTEVKVEAISGVKIMVTEIKTAAEAK